MGHLPHGGAKLFCDAPFLSRVFSINTDYGTERLIPDFGDCLIDFLLYVGVKVPASDEVQELLFPAAVANPGWFHVWDGVLRLVLCSLSWFGGRIAIFKHFIKFIRDHRGGLMEVFEKAGLLGGLWSYQKDTHAPLCELAVGHNS